MLKVNSCSNTKFTSVCALQFFKYNNIKIKQNNWDCDKKNKKQLNKKRLLQNLLNSVFSLELRTSTMLVTDMGSQLHP